MGLLAHHQRLIGCDKRLVCTTAATDDIHHTLIDDFSHLGCHRLGCLVVESQRVRQSGIRIGRDIIRCLASQFPEERLHLGGTKRAVQSQ